MRTSALAPLTATVSRRARRNRTLGATLVGFAVGGFFDGILLHQILQWHHLLSAVDALRQDIAAQVLADGLFHAAMYVVAAVGAVVLWRSRSSLSEPSAGAHVAGFGLVGFGVWHMIDGIVSHAWLGIHRVRMDSASPWVWDLAWFVAFGVVVVAAGVAVIRRASRTPAPPDGEVRQPERTRPYRAGSLAAAVAVGLAALGGVWAARAPAAVSENAVVAFAPGTPAPEVIRALSAADARVLWIDTQKGLWAVYLPQPERAAALYRHGAYAVLRSPLLLGCLAWTRGAT